MIVLALYWSNINEKTMFYFSHSKQRKWHLMSCVFATTKIHGNQNSTRPSGQPTRFFIALRTELFDMPNFFALCCGPLGDQDPVFISHIPDLKHWKTDTSGFWQTTGKSKLQPQAFPWKILCQRSVSVSRSTAAFTIFFTGTELLSCSRILYGSDSAHPGSIHVPVRSLIDVAHEGTPAWALCVHPLHSQVQR